jgi:hypothetical protein
LVPLEQFWLDDLDTEPPSKVGRRHGVSKATLMLPQWQPP